MTSTKNIQESIQNGDKGSRMTNTKHNDQMMPAPSGQDQPPPPPSHQQDLIRLLAQHFNSQLYQMTATNNHRLPDVNSSNQLLHNFSNSAPGGALNFQSSSILSQYQQQHRQFRGLMNYGPTNTTNLLSHLDQQTGLANQISRSHHQTSSSSSSGPSSHHHHPHGQQHDTTLPMSNAANNPLACNSLFGDANMNLFNALNCFNVNSDQFLLSLQQQYLLQAASTVRQMESRQLISNNEDMNRIVETNSHGHGTRTIAGKGELAMGGGRSGVADLSSVENNNGKELLKFSINTILGRGSPAQNSTVNSDVKNNTNHASAMKNQYLIERAGGGAYLSRENEPANMTTPDCDQELNTTDIDSCSSLTTTPQPSVANQTNNPFGQLAGHQPSSSGSMNNQSGDLAIDMNKQHSSGHHQAPLSFLSGSSTFPWTVAARGKPRRGMMRRAVFSDSQRVGLEKRFQLQKYISKPDRKKLAEKLGLRDSQVKIWFQNRRMKWRNSKERELLSAGGSREQTLPTRNNPNPDLSDVGETIKRIVSGPNSIGAA